MKNSGIACGDDFIIRPLADTSNIQYSLFNIHYKERKMIHRTLGIFQLVLRGQKL